MTHPHPNHQGARIQSVRYLGGTSFQHVLPLLCLSFDSGACGMSFNVDRLQIFPEKRKPREPKTKKETLCRMPKGSTPFCIYSSRGIVFYPLTTVPKHERLVGMPPNNLLNATDVNPGEQALSEGSRSRRLVSRILHEEGNQKQHGRSASFRVACIVESFDRSPLFESSLPTTHGLFLPPPCDTQKDNSPPPPLLGRFSEPIFSKNKGGTL